MKRHDTPRDVANALSRHAPHTIRALLDPAVGAGNLIAPLVSRVTRQDAKVYCVDSDIGAITSFSGSYRGSLPSRTKFIHSDFLSWSAGRPGPKFDCIVMNPPFAATKGELRRLERPGDYRSTGTTIRYMPLEAAFVCRAIDLLEDRGRLLAILPCSVVMSERLQWLRDELLSQGAIRFVHELPPRSFPRVESRMYLLVFDKGCRQRQISFLNHDLHKPERLKLRLARSPLSRLDFGYVNAGARIERLRQFEWLGWKSLGDVAGVTRGDINSPDGPQCAVHSTDFRNGFWRASERHDASVVADDGRRVQRGDILMVRVGRNAYRSFGRGIGIHGMACSDCVVIVRPRNVRLGTKLLFALRVILAQEWARPLLERGTGASYISHRSLLELPIPMDVCSHYPRHFEAFRNSERIRSGKNSQSAVQVVAGLVDRLCEEM